MCLSLRPTHWSIPTSFNVKLFFLTTPMHVTLEWPGEMGVEQAMMRHVSRSQSVETFQWTHRWFSPLRFTAKQQLCCTFSRVQHCLSESRRCYRRGFLWCQKTEIKRAGNRRFLACETSTWGIGTYIRLHLTGIEKK